MGPDPGGGGTGGPPDVAVPFPSPPGGGPGPDGPLPPGPLPVPDPKDPTTTYTTRGDFKAGKVVGIKEYRRTIRLPPGARRVRVSECDVPCDPAPCTPTDPGTPPEGPHVDPGPDDPNRVVVGLRIRTSTWQVPRRFLGRGFCRPTPIDCCPNSGPEGSSRPDPALPVTVPGNQFVAGWMQKSREVLTPQKRVGAGDCVEPAECCGLPTPCCPLDELPNQIWMTFLNDPTLLGPPPPYFFQPCPCLEGVRVPLRFNPAVSFLGNEQDGPNGPPGPGYVRVWDTFQTGFPAEGLADYFRFHPTPCSLPSDPESGIFAYVACRWKRVVDGGGPNGQGLGWEYTLYGCTRFAPGPSTTAKLSMPHSSAPFAPNILTPFPIGTPGCQPFFQVGSALYDWGQLPFPGGDPGGCCGPQTSWAFTTLRVMVTAQ